MLNSRCNILLIDKKEKYSFLFKGLRKNKFSLNPLKTMSNLLESDLVEINLFFIVLYDNRDVFELLRLKNSDTPIIVGSENVTILKKIKKTNCFSIIDLSSQGNLNSGMYDCMRQLFG